MTISRRSFLRGLLASAAAIPAVALAGSPATASPRQESPWVTFKYDSGTWVKIADGKATITYLAVDGEPVALEAAMAA